MDSPDESWNKEVPAESQRTLEDFEDLFRDSFHSPLRREVRTGGWIHPVHLLQGASPAYARHYKLSLAASSVRKNTAVEFVRGLLARGLIEPSTIPWSSTLVTVAGHDGTLTACHDYRKFRILYAFAVLQHMRARVALQRSCLVSVCFAWSLK